MYSTSSQSNQAVLYATNWIKKGRYVLVELCACSMRHSVNSKFFLHQPLQELYPLAQAIALDLGDWLSGVDLRRDIISQPYIKLLKAGAKPQDLTEFLGQLQLFFEESLKNGFNAPPEPIKKFLLTRLHAYLQETNTMLYGLNTHSSVAQVEEPRHRSLNPSLHLFGN